MFGNEIDDIFWVPKDFHLFKDGNQVLCHPRLRLPDYELIGISLDEQLTLTDCHSAMRAAIRQARLMVFEIAGKDKPFFKRSLKGTTLEGEPRKFYVLLSSIESRFEYVLSITSINELFRRGSRLLDVLKNPLIAPKDFKDSSDTLPPNL